MRQIVLGLLLLPFCLSATPISTNKHFPPPSTAPQFSILNSPFFTDTIAPTITCPPSVTLDVPNGACQVAHFYTVTATDNEPGVFYFQVTGLASGEEFPVGATINSFAAADLAGNTATCSFKVTVQYTTTTLICKNNVTVTLGTDCSSTLNHTAMLEPGLPYACAANYSVELDKTAPYGNGPWITATLSATDLGRTYQFRVTDLSSGNKCWGNVQAKDGLGPVMTCQDLSLSCAIGNYSPDYLRDSLGLGLWIPTASDACGGTATPTFSDTETQAPCDSAFHKIITRRWTATDPSGNTSTCNQRIVVLRMKSSDIKYPPDAVLGCPNPNISPAATGKPKVLWNGKLYDLETATGCSFTANFTDTTEALCGGSRRLKRTWMVISWCDGKTLHHVQNIDIQDSNGPVIACPTNPVLTTTATNCSGVVNLPDVVITDGCSRLTGIRAYWTAQGVADSLTGTLVNFAANDPLKFDTLGMVGVDSIFPVGQTVVRYEATDACGNKGSCTALLEVWDQTPPTAKCDSTVLGIALDADGSVDVASLNFDGGSSDLCTPVGFKALRKLSTGCQENVLFDDQVFFCCEDIGDTVLVTLRVYDVALPAGGVVANFATGHYSTCTARVRVTDGLPPRCVAPPDVTVLCKEFDPTLEYYGGLVSKTCLVDSVVMSLDSSQFNWSCKNGMLTRYFRTFDAAGFPGSSCSQRITVNYEQNYFVRFPDDKIATGCDATNVWGEPTFFGIDCERISSTYSDEVFTVVPDACYKIERTWTVFNSCSYNPSLPRIVVPNPNPSAIANSAQNLPGPVVSSSADPVVVPLPWTATVVAQIPGAPPTDFSTYWSATTNGYSYKQIIKVIDTQDPVITSCPQGGISTGDLTANDNLLWNETYWSDQGNQDMREAPVNLSISATDACAGPNLTIKYLLHLDLDGNGSKETVISSASLPTAGTVNYNNFGNPNFSGGTTRAFDQRPVAANLKYRFALQTLQAGNHRTARVVWNTPSNPVAAELPQLPYGQHKIMWIAEDGCGNETTCEYIFTLTSGPLPLMACDTSFQVAITPQNFVNLPLSAVLPAVLDYKTPDPTVEFGIRRSGSGTGFPANATSVSFGCFDIGNRTVEVWARDPQGRTSNCTLPVSVVDLEGHCNNPSPKEVAGHIRNEYDEGVAQVSVKLQSPALASTPTVTTDAAGAFFYNATVPAGSGYELVPSKDVAPLNGVSTYDLVLISKHILGLEAIPNPYRLIAADGNRSGSITTFDIVEFRKLILGIYPKMPNCPSWRFVPKSFVFPDPLNPFKTVFPEIISVPAIFGDSLTQNLVAIKVGDMNRSAMTNATGGTEDRDGSPLFFDVENRTVRQGDVFSLTLQAAEPTEGYQFTLEHSGLQLLDLQAPAGLSEDHFALFDEALTVSCELPQSGVFTATFRAEQSGLLSQMLHFSDRITQSEAYRSPLTPHASPLALRFSGLSTATPFELYQNQPNPFSDITTIGFSLPESSTATLSVYDQVGRIVYSTSGTWAKGYQSLSIWKSELAASGVLYYRLETPTHNAVRKMVRE